MSVSEAATALARGHEITLMNGQKYRFVITMYTLAVLEDELGSLAALDGNLDGTTGKTLRTIAKLLANSLTDGHGYPVAMGEDEILRLIPLEDLGAVMAQVQAGLTLAFQPAPSATVDTGAIQETIAARTTPASPGEHYSTSGAPSSTSPSAIFGN